MKKQLCFWIILITLVGILPSLLQYGCFLLATDLAFQEVPFIIETKRMLMSGAPLWSWNHLLGDSFIGSYSFYTLTSPFVWINCLFPDKWMLHGITFTLFLKMICLGFAAYGYLRKMSVKPELSVVGALMYTFSSFAVSNLFYYHFLEPMIVFPIFLIAIERYLKQEQFSCTGLALSSFLVFFINYYFATCSMIVGLIYVLCRLTSNDVKAGIDRVAVGFLMVGIGMLLSGFILLPTIAHLEGSPRETFDLSSLYYGLLFCPERLSTLFIPKLIEGENPAFYSFPFSSNAANVPVVGLLLAGLYITRHKNWLTILVIIMVAFYVTPLNGVFSLFTNPVYSRWAYALTLFIILASMKYVETEQPVTMHSFKFYAITACLAVLLSYTAGMSFNLMRHGVLFVHSAILINVIILIVFLVQMLVLYYYVKHYKPSVLLGCVIVMSMIYFPIRVLMNTDAFGRSGYRSEWCGTIRQYLLENHLPYHHGDFVWRTDFQAWHPNISMLKNRPSTSTSSSIQNNNLPQLLKAVGSKVDGITVKAAKDTASFDALMSVKEIVDYDQPSQPSGPLKLAELESLSGLTRERCLSNKRQGKGYTTYDNKYYIPMGFTYDSYITQSCIDSLMAADEQADIPLQLLANLAVPDSLIDMASGVLDKGRLSSDLSLDSLVMERRKNVCSSFAGNTRGFHASVNMTKKNLLFFSVPCDKGFTGYVDGVKTRIYPANLGLSAIMVDQGEHQIEFRFFPRGLSEGIMLTLIGLALTLLVLLADIKSRRQHVHAHTKSQKHHIHDKA